LEKRGIKVNIKTVQKRMKKLKIKSIIVKKFKNHKTKEKIREQPNIIKQDFTTTTINEKWCGDITYIHIAGTGWTYLASVMDMHTNKIIGYSYSRKMDKELVIKAMKNACINVKNTKGIIFHSDLGTQYTSKEFNEILNQKGIKHSYSKKGTPYDNAKIESFHSIIKKEEIYVKKYKNFEEAKIKIFEYIELFYNRKRIHSSIDYMTPQEKEDEAIKLLKKRNIA
jgi:transposase